MRDAQRGSAEALEELFRRHWRRAHRAAYLVVGDAAAAEDIAQEAFLAAIRRPRPLRPPAPVRALAAPDRGQPRDRLRPGAGAARRERARRDARGARAAPAPDAISDELLAALAELGPEHRAVVVLRYVLEYTPGEIGEMLGLPRGTVNSRLRRGLDRLRPAIEEATAGS